MQQMQAVFNSRMEPIKAHEDYPKYARSGTKPVVRARAIIDQGLISIRPCSTCVELKIDCYRWEGTYSRCAWCTAKDVKQEKCHLPGETAATPKLERRKRRKITGNIYAPVGGGDVDDAGSTADGPATLASATTSFYPHIPMMSSNKRSLSENGTSPELASALNGIIHTHVVPPAAAEAGSGATLERVTALESQVSGLEAKVLEVLVKLGESSRSGSASSTPRPQQAAAGASPASSDIMSENLEAQALSYLAAAAANEAATRDWLEGPKTPLLSD